MKFNKQYDTWLFFEKKNNNTKKTGVKSISQVFKKINKCCKNDDATVCIIVLKLITVLCLNKKKIDWIDIRSISLFLDSDF